MKIYNEQNKVAKSASGKSVAATPKDEVILSSKAQEFGPMLEKLKNMPEVRQDKVQEISQSLQSGSYQVDSGAVANKMIGRLMADQLPD
ncbi:flagellar biosynthesis anti-sigma factor FlgM [Lucifera butyrica]|nr:flagellar biosynthesis anti-sigma factor FlgM [Lucifera butyrica]